MYTLTRSSTAEKQKSLSVSGIILPPHVVVGQKGRVTVSIEGRRVDRVETSWFLNDTPITDTSRKGTTARPRPLLRRDAQVRQLDHALYLDVMHRYASSTTPPTHLRQWLVLVTLHAWVGWATTISGPGKPARPRFTNRDYRKGWMH